jgi:ribulose bisphosphate carboxylase small subunit
VGSILGLGVTALVHWIRSKGIPVSDQQEAMFRDIVTSRFAKLAKDSWKEMREHPKNLDRYWDELSQGHIPKEFQDKLKKEGYDFAMELKQNREFRDFARDITKDVTGKAMERLLKDLRTNLANEYQEYMIDVIPKIASTAVDSAFDPKVDNVETWAKTALENLKPLLLSTEAIDTEKNLMIIIRAEINKRLQERLKKSRKN